MRAARRTEPAVTWTARLAARLAMLVAFALPALASAQDLTDHWYSPDEPGWGLSIQHQRNVMFAVLFVYSNTAVDAGGRGAAEWFVAPDLRLELIGDSPIAIAIYRGPLYSGRGSPFPGAFQPSATNLATVGEMTIAPLSENERTLTYRINGQTVTKRIRRMSLARPALTGTYAVSFTGVANRSTEASVCPQAGTFTTNDTWIVDANGANGAFRVTRSGASPVAFDMRQEGSTLEATFRSTSGPVPGGWTLRLDHAGSFGWVGSLSGRSDSTVTANLGGQVVTLAECTFSARFAAARVTNENPQ